MPDALLLANDSENSFKIDSFFKEHKFRFKFTYEEGLLEEWLHTLPFDILLLPAEISFEAQQKFAYLLWEYNPHAYLVLFDPNDKFGNSEKKLRLFGASLATGDKCWESLERISYKILGCKYIKKSEFRILVVEDLDSPRDIICSYIENLGYPQVSGVQSAEEALKAIKKNSQAFDCIITDERMPNLSGHELIEAIRKNDNLSNLPVIVLTAHGTYDCLEESLKAGASGFLTKPPAKNDLIREVARAMRIRLGLQKARLLEENQTGEISEVLGLK